MVQKVKTAATADLPPTQDYLTRFLFVLNTSLSAQDITDTVQLRKLGPGTKFWNLDTEEGVQTAYSVAFVAHLVESREYCVRVVHRGQVHSFAKIELRDIPAERIFSLPP